MTIAVYAVTHLPTGKLYIGASINAEYRLLYNHRSSLRRGASENRFLQEDWNRYGEMQFSFEIVEVCSEENLRDREKFHIDFFADSGLLYNIHRGREGIDQTDSRRRQRSESVKNYWKNPGVRRSLRGRGIPKARRLKQSQSMKERWKDPEFYRKMMKARGRNV